MRKFIIAFILVALASPPQGIVRAADSSPAKTYRNPLLPDHEIADPDVIRVDGKYYLYPTSNTRGYEVFVSEDLVHWTLKGLVFDDPRRGAWAPDVFHNKRGDKKFYLYYTDNLPGTQSGGLNKQIGVAVADGPPRSLQRQRHPGGHCH
jgi:hypothetical protein